MKYAIETASIFEFGQRTDSQGNPHQEDCIFPAHGEAKPYDRLFIVCDGMGGHDAGEVASAAVCQAMSQSIIDSETDPEGDFTQEDFDRALDAAFLALDRKDTGAAKKMGTTMAMLKLYRGGALITWMGDSRVYQLRPTEAGIEIAYRTDDHSLVNDLVKLGEITEEEALIHPRRNVITRALQPALPRRPKADVKWIEDIRQGDIFYLCTDGMLEEMSDRMLCRFFTQSLARAEASDKPLDALAADLIEETRFNRDNHSALLVRIDSVSADTDADADADTDQPDEKQNWFRRFF